MKKKILVCLDLLKYPFSGIGKVSIDFSTELMTRELQEQITYLVPSENHGYAAKLPSLEMLSSLKKYFSGYMKKYELIHVTHQLPRFTFQKARKVVLTIHDLNFLHVKSEKKQKKYTKRVQKYVDKSDYLCFISEFTMQECLKHLKINDSTPKKVIYNGVSNLAKVDLKPEWCPENEFIFSIGQFLNKKNFHVLIPFLKLLPESISLVIAGQNTTSYGEELKRLIESEGLQDRVFLPNTITEDEKSYLYYHCKAFVFPSIAEGFGLPVIEAMKCNKPVFCSDKTSLKEIGNEFAFFWKTFDPEEMLHVFNSGMATFNNNIDYQMKQKAYADSYTWKRNVDEYIEVYNALLD